MNLTRAMAISIAVLSALMVANTQLTDLFGAFWTTKITSGAALLNLILGGIATATSGPPSQDQQVKQVLAMPGVQHIDVNANASPALAKLAVDPTVDKIAPTPAAVSTVTQTAKQG